MEVPLLTLCHYLYKFFHLSQPSALAHGFIASPVLLHKINELNSQPTKKTAKQISIRHD